MKVGLSVAFMNNSALLTSNLMWFSCAVPAGLTCRNSGDRLIYKDSGEFSEEFS